VALKGVNDQQEGWRLRVRKLVLSEENDYENRGCQYWEPIRYPFDDFPYQHVTRTPRDRVTPRRLEVISKIAAVQGVQYRCTRRQIPAFEADVEVVSCHHNYVTWEHHYGENVLITRKGSVRAREGDMGIIPGSSTRSRCASITASMDLYAIRVSSMTFRILTALDAGRSSTKERQWPNWTKLSSA
jgi:hypothetical protein